MSWNGSGVYSVPYNWTNDAANGIKIVASRQDAQWADLVTAMNNVLTRDGQGIATANLPMGTFRHTGAGNAVGVQDYTTAHDVQNNALLFAVGGGSADAITATYAPAFTSLVDGMQLCFRAPGTNATTTPTFAPNSLTANAITKFGGTALAVGDIQNGQECIVRYVSASTRWELLVVNPAANTGVSLSANNIWTGTQTFGVAGNVGKLLVAGSTSGTLTLAAPATGAGTATFFGGSDTVAGLAASQAFTNKSYNGMTLTASTGTFTLANAKTLTVSNTLTLTATDGSTLAIGSGGTLGSAAYQNTGTSGANVPLLNGANVWANQVNGPLGTLTDGASIAWAVGSKQIATVTLGGNRTLANETGAVAGGTYILVVTQDGTGSRTLAYGTNYKWPGGTAPTLSTAAGAVDVLTFISPNGTLMYGVAQKAFS